MPQYNAGVCKVPQYNAGVCKVPQYNTGVCKVRGGDTGGAPAPPLFLHATFYCHKQVNHALGNKPEILLKMYKEWYIILTTFQPPTFDLLSPPLKVPQYNTGVCKVPGWRPPLTQTSLPCLPGLKTCTSCPLNTCQCVKSSLEHR